MGQEPQPAEEPGITFQGSGESPEDPVIIKGAPNHQLGVAAEYRFISHKYGLRDVHWRLEMQMLLKGPRMMDLIGIELADGTKKEIYFDLSDFWGKIQTFKCN
jgi:hypothetical protein